MYRVKVLLSILVISLLYFLGNLPKTRARAVEKRLIAGKIIVYPACKGLGLVRLEELNVKMPEVAECLNNGLWTKKAEEKLLERYREA